MQAKLINQAGRQRSFVIVLSSGDEVMACLKRFVEQEKIEAAQFSAIGAFRSAALGYFDWETKKYPREINERCAYNGAGSPSYSSH